MSWISLGGSAHHRRVRVAGKSRRLDANAQVRREYPTATPTYLLPQLTNGFCRHVKGPRMAKSVENRGRGAVRRIYFGEHDWHRGIAHIHNRRFDRGSLNKPQHKRQTRASAILSLDPRETTG